MSSNQNGGANPLTKKTSFAYEDLIDCAQGRLFGMGNARLPMPPLLMLDRIIRITEDGGEFGKGELIAELDVNPELWFFKCHFEGDPVMPGCLGLDALWQLVGFFLGWLGMQGQGRALGVGAVKFSGQVLPKVTTVSYQIHIRRVIRRKLNLGIARGLVIADGETIYEAEDLRVGLFTQTA